MMTWAAAMAMGGCVGLALVHRSPLAIIVAALPVLAAAGVFTLQRPYWILWLMVFTAPFKDQLGVQVGGLNVRAYNALALAGMIWLAWKLLLGSPVSALRVLFREGGVWIPLGLFLVGKVLTLFFIQNLPPGMTPAFSAKYILFYGTLFCTGLLTHVLIEKKETLHLFLKGWVYLSNAILVVAFLQILLSNLFHFHYVHHRDVIFFGRPFGVFREPDVLGSFVGATFLMLLPQVLFRETALLKARTLFLSLGAHGLFLVILFVRAAWVATIACLGILFLSAVRNGYLPRLMPYIRRSLLMGAGMLLLLLILAPGFADVLVGRFASLSKPSGESASEYRMRELSAMVEKTVQSDLQSFLFGHGDFAWTFWAPYLLGENFDRSAIEAMAAGGGYFVHAGFCMMLTVFFDNGILGAVLMSVFIWKLFDLFYRTLRLDRSPETMSLMWMTFLPVVCVLICFQFSFDPITPFFWVQVGLFLSAQHLIHEEVESDDAHS